MTHSEISCFRILFDITQAAAGVLHSVLLLGAAVVILVAFAEGASIHEEHLAGNLTVTIAQARFSPGVLNGHDRFFGSVHAAHRGAVIMALVSAADAL
jgi:hypothetical protein